jgi:xylulokinase
MALVAGIDSSTQSCKVVIRDAHSGALVREGRAPHPPGTEIDPWRWWLALQAAVEGAGGLGDVDAVSIAAQQHGMVCLDDDGAVVRSALLWNDTRSASAAGELVAELGAESWAQAVGSVPIASFTVAKLRWLATHEPENARRVVAVCLPHDWLTWKLAGAEGLDALRTDRGDASGTGYWSAAEGRYRHDLLRQAFGSDIAVPVVLSRNAVAGHTGTGAVIAAGTGDNMAAAFGLGAEPGDLVVSIGTSGVVSAVSDAATADATGSVAGFADATGRYLPLVCTLNAAPVITATARMLGVSREELSDLALSAPPGADGLVLVPYLEGERTPNLPGASGILWGLRHRNTTPAHVARAAVEGLLCGLHAGLLALEDVGVTGERIVLVGGGARSPAIRQVAPAIFGRPVLVPAAGEYVADGAARQAAWVLSGDDPPPTPARPSPEIFEAPSTPEAVERYGAAVALMIGVGE